MRRTPLLAADPDCLKCLRREGRGELRARLIGPSFYTTALSGAHHQCYSPYYLVKCEVPGAEVHGPLLAELYLLPGRWRWRGDLCECYYYIESEYDPT